MPNARLMPINTSQNANIDLKSLLIGILVKNAILIGIEQH